jgi:signal transduction histidine kinase
MRSTNGTIQSTDGLSGITGRLPTANLKLAGLALTALLGTLVVAWVSRTTWQRVEDLQHEFAELKADNFYLGVRMRSDILRLNETLLRYRLRGDTNDSEAFRSEAHAFKQWFDHNAKNAITPLERTFFDQVTTAYDDYLVECTPVLEASVARRGENIAKDFTSSYKKIQVQSKRLLNLCDSFISNQRTAFAVFLKGSIDTLTAFKQLLQLALVLLLVLAAALVVLAYRGMIAPLRHQLNETQAIMVRQEKLASLGSLAAGVAHEIRNPLTAIKVRLYSLKKSLPDGGVGNEDTTVIGDELNRLERIVQDFLHFARPSEPEFVVAPVQRISEEVCALLRPQLEKSGIHLNVEPSESAWVRADTQQIKQVLINLIQNSADSIGHDGVITLRTRHEHGSAFRGIGRTVAFDVEDNGKGIPPELRKRLFDPFFTTKEGGTGLGLPIAARIVEKHGGELRYQTELRRGTIFSVILPSVPENETDNLVDRR